MKQIVWIILMILLAIPAFAQDDGEGGPEGGGDFFGGEGLSTADRSTPKIDPLADLRNWLAKAGAPSLEKKQEKPLNKVYDNEVKAMSKTFEKRFGISLQAAIAAQSPARGRRAAGSRIPNPEQTV